MFTQRPLPDVARVFIRVFAGRQPGHLPGCLLDVSPGVLPGRLLDVNPDIYPGVCWTSARAFTRASAGRQPGRLPGCLLDVSPGILPGCLLEVSPGILPGCLLEVSPPGIYLRVGLEVVRVSIRVLGKSPSSGWQNQPEFSGIQDCTATQILNALAGRQALRAKSKQPK